MDYENQMKTRILATLHSIVDVWELEWVEISAQPSQGTVRLMQTGSFLTLLKIEYEFRAEHFRLLVYRDDKHIAGQCNIDYDDGIAIEQILAQFRALSPDTHAASSQTPSLSPAAHIPASHPNRLQALILSAGKSLPF
jgi:hypothetical protein